MESITLAEVLILIISFAIGIAISEYINEI